MAAPLPVSAPTLRALEAGAALFDAERFFDAHEVWEDAWRHEAGAARQLLQGLIQIAAGFHRGLARGAPAGMARLLGRGLARLDGAGGLGLVDLPAFRRDVERWDAAARGWAEGGSRPALPAPRLGPRLLPRSPEP